MLAEAGATVLVADIEDEAAHSVVEGIRDHGGEAEFRRLDVTDEQNWHQLIQHVETAYGNLDVLVNNAGIALVKPLEETTLEDFRRVTRVNVDGVFLGIKHALPLMKKSATQNPAGGSIINLSSVVGNVGIVYGVAYGMSKGAVRNMTKCVALECAHLGYNIRVNSVHPGIIDTPMVEAEARYWTRTGALGTRTLDETLAALTALHPLGRFGTPDEVARAVLYLASDDSAFTTGTEHIVDGGALAM